jgi:hypothetical protein
MQTASCLRLDLKGKKQMQRIAVKLIVGVAISAVAIFAADNSVGTWKYNPAKSKSTSTSFKSRTDVREATPDGGVKVTRTEESPKGESFNATFSYKYDGKEYPVTGTNFDTISTKQVNANTLTWEVKRADGKYHQTGKNVVSKDGKTMTQTFKGTDIAGKPVHGTNVYEKQ